MTLQNKTELIDSFREVYPDPLSHPGFTWSTINQSTGAVDDYLIPETLDRIDFIFYKSDGLKTVESGPYAGDFLPYPNDVSYNDWPSDHYAFVSAFKGY